MLQYAAMDAATVVEQLDVQLERLTAAGLTGICTIAQAMALTGASRRTIYYWITKGWVDVRYTPSGKARVVVSTLQQRGAA